MSYHTKATTPKPKNLNSSQRMSGTQDKKIEFGSPADPQPHNLAPSRNALLQTIGFYFGDPAHPEKLKDYTEHHAATLHFPDAYVGSSNRLRDTLTNLITENMQEWMTTEALPWTQVQGIQVEWDENHFDVRIMQRVPYEGVSRLQTSLRRRHRERAVRRGIGMVLESDFYMTQAGKRHFSDNLLSIQLCVQETCNFDGLFAYLTCENFDFGYDLSRALISRRSLVAAMQSEVSMYAIVQKDGRGFDRAVEDAKTRMARYHVKPNMMIIAPQLALYASIVPEPRISHYLGGEKAISDYRAGPAGLQEGTFRGLKVQTVNPFDVGDSQESVQLLQRPVQVGEYYVLDGMPPIYRSSNTTATPPVPPAEHIASVLVYDEEKDNLQLIRLAEALKASCIQELAMTIANHARSLPYPGTPTTTYTDAQAVAYADNKLFKLEAYLTDSTNEAAVLRDILAAGLAANASEANTYLTTMKAFYDNTAEFYNLNSSGGQAILNALQKGVRLPIACVVARPFIEHNMLSSIITVAGSDTGCTLFGPADMQLSANTATKVIEGHYTCHTKSVITKPKNVFIQRDIMSNGYVAGCNTKFFGAKAAVSTNNIVTPEGVKDSMQKRLNFDNDYDGDEIYESMLAFAMHPDEVKDFSENAFNITRRYMPFEASSSPDSGAWPADSKKFPGGGTLWSAYNSVWQLSDTIMAGEDGSAVENKSFVTGGTVNNGVCIVGPHRTFDITEDKFSRIVPGQGHWGPDALPGDARWRRGESISMMDARAAMSYTDAILPAYAPRAK